MRRRSVLGCVKAVEENEHLLKFLVEESKQAENPLNVRQLGRDFSKKSGSSRTVNALFQKSLAVVSKVPKMDNIDKETKVRMLFALGGQVNEEYLNELRKDAVVDVDTKQRITKYESKDGSLKLEGNHNAGAKIKAGWENRRRSFGIPCDLQEEMEEDDVEDIEEENKQVTTQRGRLVKKPRLYDNSPFYKTKEELMDIVGHDIPVQLQNEFVKSQSSGTSSENNTIKSKVNTQIPESIQKRKKPNLEGGTEPEEDVTYDGTREPPRHVELSRKREPVEKQIVLTEDKEKQENKKRKQENTLGLFGNLNNFKFEENVKVSPTDAVDNFSTELSTPNSTIKSMKASLEGRAEREDDVVYEGPKKPPLPVQLPRKREPVEEPIVLLDDKEHPNEKKPLGVFGKLNDLQLEKDVQFEVFPENAVDSSTAPLSESSSMIVFQPSSDSIKITEIPKPLRETKPEENVVYECPEKPPRPIQLPRKSEYVEKAIVITDDKEHPKEKKPKPEEEVVDPEEPPRPVQLPVKSEAVKKAIVLTDIKEQQQEKNPETFKLFENSGNLKLEEDVDVSPEGTVESSMPKSSIKSMKTSSERGSKPEEDVIYEGPGEPPLPVQLPRNREVKKEPVEEKIVLLENEEQPKQKNLKLEEDVSFKFSPENVGFEVSPEDAVDSFSITLSSSSSMNVSQLSDDSIKITQFLKSLRSLVGTLESPKLCGLHEKIDLKIKEFRDQNLKAPIKFILFSLESVIIFVIKNAATRYLEEDSTSLKEFLLIFKAAAYNLIPPEFTDFQKSLRDAINQIGNQDKKVSFEKIQNGLEDAINFVLP